MLLCIADHRLCKNLFIAIDTEFNLRLIETTVLYQFGDIIKEDSVINSNHVTDGSLKDLRSPFSYEQLVKLNKKENLCQDTQMNATQIGQPEDLAGR